MGLLLSHGLRIFLEPTRNIWRPHTNGIFDVKWNHADTLLASASGDQSTRISCPTSSRTLYSLRGHTSTVKCVAWDPANENLLSTGGRDGSICMWDLRVGEGSASDDEGVEVLNPVITVASAHGIEGATKPRARSRGKGAPLARSVTSLLYPEEHPYMLISSGSSDGYAPFYPRIPGKLTIANAAFFVLGTHDFLVPRLRNHRSQPKQKFTSLFARPLSTLPNCTAPAVLAELPALRQALGRQRALFSQLEPTTGCTNTHFPACHHSRTTNTRMSTCRSAPFTFAPPSRRAAGGLLRGTRGTGICSSMM